MGLGLQVGLRQGILL